MKKIKSNVLTVYGSRSNRRQFLYSSFNFAIRNICKKLRQLNKSYFSREIYWGTIEASNWKLLFECIQEPIMGSCSVLYWENKPSQYTVGYFLDETMSALFKWNHYCIKSMKLNIVHHYNEKRCNFIFQDFIHLTQINNNINTNKTWKWADDHLFVLY